jgi:hypothetical protein
MLKIETTTSSNPWYQSEPLPSKISAKEAIKKGRALWNLALFESVTVLQQELFPDGPDWVAIAYWDKHGTSFNIKEQ